LRRLATVRLPAGESGYTITEMLTVMVIMTIVMTGLVSVFTAASGAQNDRDRRYQAQQNTRLALDKLRRDVHCAYDITPNTPNPWSTAQSTVTLKNTACTGGDVSWCTAAVAGYSNRWALYRQLGASCASGSGVKQADYLTTSTPFSAFAHVAGCGCLASVGVTFPISIKGSTVGAYKLNDTLYLRNSTRI
jgi:prepilin-type N-terminal cleavage/methylation domain-containing protein